VTRTTISFDSHGQKCAGWFYPAAADGRAACVVMAHGLAAVKEMRLDAYAERFAAAGYNVLVFDYRHFGASEGTPRQLLDIRRQHQDWVSAVSHARSRAEVDPNRIALWGTSLSGGHVLAVAGEVGAAAVISQVPHTDGLASVLALGRAQSLKLTGHAIYDVARDLLGRSPHYVPASGKPGTTALMSAPEAADYLRLVPEGYDFDQSVAARFALRIGLYSPGRKAKRLDVPVLVQVGGRDATTPPKAAIKAGERAPLGTVRVYDVGHFEPYTGEMFETFVTEQIAFLRNTLKTTEDTEMSRTIVITGAGAGIGREAARRFAQRGWTLCATDLNHDALEALENELGPRHTYAKMDVTDKAEVEAVFADFAGRHGGAFDALLNNAGVAFIQNFEEQTLEQHELVAKVNINGVLNCTYLAFPYLAKGRDAKLINMCSLSSEYGIPSEATYSASKFFVRGFTEAMNIEWERHGIHVCDVLPNFVATPMMDAAHGNIVDSIGVNLTADHVADTIAKAADDRSKVHWVVDTGKLKVVRVLMNNSPAPLHRAAIKKFAGF
jgi:NAD(P)-dependent dehydrogenase (short-subunit alcohol dehydrogenase family)/pimeloyl-ACP methyl ester carboxylesterase